MTKQKSSEVSNQNEGSYVILEKRVLVKEINCPPEVMFFRGANYRGDLNSALNYAIENFPTVLIQKSKHILGGSAEVKDVNKPFVAVAYHPGQGDFKYKAIRCSEAELDEKLRELAKENKEADIFAGLELKLFPTFGGAK